MRTQWLCCLLAAWLILPGCSKSVPQTAEVSGTVQLNGHLVEEGSIQFIPVDGTSGPSAGGIIKHGKYRIDRKNGATVGKNRVELRAFKESSTKIQDPTAPQGVMTIQRIPAFPPEFNDRSTLIREIKPGSNAIDFDVRTTEEK